MADAYYLRYRGRTVGPYTLIQSQQMARKGQLARTSEVSTDGHSWSQAASFPEIFELTANSRSLATSNSTATHEVAVVTTTSSANQVAPRAPAIASSEWYYASGGEQQGPTSASNIIGWIKAGTLTSADRVWRDGLDNWVSISDVPEFNAAIGPTAPHRAAGGGGAGGGAFCRECGASINRRAVICTQCGVPTDAESDPLEQLAGRSSSRSSPGAIGRHHSGPPKSKSVAALLALFLGGLGGHHFYLGNIVLGVIYLLFCMTFIPSIVAFIECIVFLCMTEEAFNAKYNA